MRRGFSIFLIMLLGLGPLSSLIDGSENVGLPACCRRHGAHHCAMAIQMAAMMRRAQSGKTPIMSAPMTCPYYPGAANALLTPPPALGSAPRTSLAQRHIEFIRVAAYMSPLAAPAKTHSGRGPPASTLS